jgi:hypothetical protein
MSYLIGIYILDIIDLSSIYKYFMQINSMDPYV